MKPRCSAPSSQRVSAPRPAPHGPTPREEYVRRVREAVNADYTMLQSSPLCELPGVVALARTTYSRKIFPTASALRALLDRAYANAIEEVGAIDDRRMRQVATYLRLSREGKSVTAITRDLGRRSRSHVHTDIQREAFEILTAAFLQLARDSAGPSPATLPAPAKSDAKRLVPSHEVLGVGRQATVSVDSASAS